MGLRYTKQITHILASMKDKIGTSSIPTELQQDLFTDIRTISEYVNAGMLVGSGRTITAFEVRTGLTKEQFIQTDLYIEVSRMCVGDTISVSVNRLWFNYARALMKQQNRDMKFRTKKLNEKTMLITRLS